jgi:hypothetical protein
MIIQTRRRAARVCQPYLSGQPGSARELLEIIAKLATVP